MNTQRSIDRGIRIASAIVLLLATQAAWAYSPPPSGFEDAASYGYNTTDATAALQNAINTGRNVWVPKMQADWTVRPIFVMGTSNQEIRFENGVVVAAKAGEFHGTNDMIFHAEGCSNLTFSGYGATLKMRKADYMQNNPSLPGYYVKSEARTALSLYSVTGATVKGLRIVETGGDGIYVGSGWNPCSEDVTIKDVAIDNAYRDGIAVISAKNLLIDNAVVTNTWGTAPQSGIDLEPDCSYEFLQNITIRNSIFSLSRACGIEFAPQWSGVPPANVTNITIDHVTSAYNQLGRGIYTGAPPELASAVTITNSLVWGNNGAIVGPFTLGAGNVTTVSPTFYSTDVTSPYYMYLDPSCSPLITQGGSGGGYMGARPVYGTPEPSAGVLLLFGGGCALAHACYRRLRLK